MESNATVAKLLAHSWKSGPYTKVTIELKRATLDQKFGLSSLDGFFTQMDPCVIIKVSSDPTLSAHGKLKDNDIVLFIEVDGRHIKIREEFDAALSVSMTVCRRCKYAELDSVKGAEE